MIKLLILLFTIILALVSLAGYLFLTQKIYSGEQQITEGQHQLVEGEQKLADGKARLQEGKQKMAVVKKANNQVLPMGMAIVSFPVSGLVYMEGKRKISEGDKLIADGNAQIKQGEERLHAGKSALSKGKKMLTLAMYIRISCAIGAVFFALLAMILGFCWRRSFFHKS